MMAAMKAMKVGMPRQNDAIRSIDDFLFRQVLLVLCARGIENLYIAFKLTERNPKGPN